MGVAGGGWQPPPAFNSREKPMRNILLTEIELSKTNPRRRRDEKADAELVESVRRHGVLQPVLVRAGSNGTPWELVAGSRRFHAAQAAGLAEIPAIEKQLSDVEALEVQVIENLQRADVHPLEEAEGYRQLSAKPGYDVATVAERVGRSVKYVYDRMKLLALTKEAKKLFLDDEIAAGHAILLARLKPSEQLRAIGDRDGLFQDEQTLLDPEITGRQEGTRKARSVRELQSWIDRNVRFDAREPDPMLFPETAEEIAQAKKFVPITFSNFIPPEAREGKTFGPRSWKRADGQRGSKTCELSTTGVVMVGPHRGEAFAVCVAKEKCSVHWAAEIRERKQRAAASTQGADSAPGRPTEPKRDEVLEKALSAARDAATEECSRRIGAVAEVLKPDAFLRAIAGLDEWDMLQVLDEMGEKAKVRGLAGIVAWVKGAPLPKVQHAIARYRENFGSSSVVASAFGVDLRAIEKEYEKKAREAHKAAQTSAQPAKPKAAAKGAKKKGGSK